MAPHNFPLPYTQANTNEKSPMVGLICCQSQIKNCEEEEVLLWTAAQISLDVSF